MLSVEDILRPENVSYTDNVWTWAVAHMLHKGEDWQITTITDTAPIEIVFLSKGEPLTDYLISGNTVQDGTPTHEAPVDASGSGVRTGNLYDGYLELGSINGNDGSDFPSTIRCRTNYIGVIQNKAYTVSAPIDCLVRFVAFYGENKEFLGYSSNGSNTYTFDTPSSTKVIRIVYGYKDDSSIIVSEFPSDKIMINLGSATLPWEPYGYKLPLTIGGTEYPIYLGKVQSTRNIKKLVLTGDEDWYGYVESSVAGVYRLELNGYLRVNTNISLSTHFETQSSVEGVRYVNEKSIAFLVSESGNNYMYIKYSDMKNVSDFKSYLAQQYTAGTPVTIWYVLATETTGIVNEPLHKIGGYADTVSFAQAGVTIPTSAGANTLTVGTTVQPSSMSITGRIREAADV